MLDKTRIISKANDVQLASGMPATLSCIVFGNQSDYNLAWREGHKYVPTGKQYSVWSGQFDHSTCSQSHHLTIHRVEKSKAYGCIVINPAGRVLDSQVHHIEVITNAGNTVTL